MSDNEKEIVNFVYEYKDTLVLDYSEVVILRCWSEDEDDYYWVLQDFKGNYRKSSCVGKVIPLKGFLPEKDYDFLKNFFQINLNLISKEIK